MEKRRCYGCMELTDQPVCPRCGSGAVENSPHQLRAGTVLAGRFLVGKALGQSSSGILYLGLDQTRGEPVNLLEYYPAQDGRRNGNLVEPAGEQAAARFAQGKAWFARVSQLLAGERELADVSGFRDGFEANGTAYRVAERVRGTSLDRYVRLRGGAIGAEEALRILAPVLRAAAAAHRAGMAHGGIRMDSIVLDPMGGARLQGFGEEPGANPGEDVLALCRVMLGCLIPEGQSLSACPEHVPGLTPGQEAALRKGLASSRKDRFASAGELCGALLGTRPEPAAVPGGSARMPEAPRKPGKKKWVWAVAAAALAVVLGILFFTVHIWKDASCTKPKTCVLCGKTQGFARGHSWQSANCEKAKTCIRCAMTEGQPLGHEWHEATCLSPGICGRCGKTQGDALGHSWVEATCTEPRTCSRCGETEGSALGHDYQAATYTSPSTCSRCGETRGNVRGYHETISGSYERFYTNTVSGWCLKLDTPIQGCRKFTLVVEITSISYGSPEGVWKAFYRNGKGEWIDLGNFTLRGTSASVTFTFDDPVDIDSVTATITGGGSFSFNKSLAVRDVYAKD